MFDFPVVNSFALVAGCDRRRAPDFVTINGREVRLYDITSCYSEDSQVESYLRVVVKVADGDSAVCDILVSQLGVRLRYRILNRSDSSPVFVNGSVGLYDKDLSSEVPLWITIIGTPLSEMNLRRSLSGVDKDATSEVVADVRLLEPKRNWAYLSKSPFPSSVSLGEHSAKIENYYIDLLDIAEHFYDFKLGSCIARDNLLKVTVGDIYERLGLRSTGDWNFTLFRNQEEVDYFRSARSLTGRLLVPSFVEGDTIHASISRTVPGYDDPVCYTYKVDSVELKELSRDIVRVGARVSSNTLDVCIGFREDHYPEFIDPIAILQVEGVPKYCQKVTRSDYFKIPLQYEWRSKMVSVRVEWREEKGAVSASKTSSLIGYAMPRSETHKFLCVGELRKVVCGRKVFVLGSGPSASVLDYRFDEKLVCVNGSMGVLASDVNPDFLVITDQTLVENSSVAEHSRSSLQGRFVTTVVAITKKLDVQEVAQKLSEYGLKYSFIVIMDNQERLDLAGSLFDRVIPPSQGNKLACSAGVTAVLLMFFAGASKVRVSGFDFSGGHFHTPDTNRAHAGMDVEVFECLNHEIGVLEVSSGNRGNK